MYCGLLDGSLVPREVLDPADLSTAKYEVVKWLLNIKKHEGKNWILVLLKRLPYKRDHT